MFNESFHLCKLVV